MIGVTKLKALVKFLDNYGLKKESEYILKIARESDVLYQTFGRLILLLLRAKKYSASVEVYDDSNDLGAPSMEYFNPYEKSFEAHGNLPYYDALENEILNQILSPIYTKNNFKKMKFPVDGSVITKAIINDISKCINDYFFSWRKNDSLREEFFKNIYSKDITNINFEKFISNEDKVKLNNCIDSIISKHCNDKEYGNFFVDNKRRNPQRNIKIIESIKSSLGDFFNLSKDFVFNLNSFNDFFDKTLFSGKSIKESNAPRKYIRLKFDRVSDVFDLFNEIAKTQYGKESVTLDDGSVISPAESLFGKKEAFNDYFKNFNLFIHEIFKGQDRYSNVQGIPHGYAGLNRVGLRYAGKIYEENVDDIIYSVVSNSISVIYHEFSHQATTVITNGYVGRQYSRIKDIKFDPEKSAYRFTKKWDNPEKNDISRYISSIEALRYYSDTEEVQARLIEAFNSFEDLAISSNDDEKSNLASAMIIMLGGTSINKDPSLFAEFMLKISRSLYANLRFFSKKHKEKIKKRIISYAKDLVKRPNFEALLNIAKSNIMMNFGEDFDFSNFNIEDMFVNEFSGLFEKEQDGIRK